MTDEHWFWIVGGLGLAVLLACLVRLDGGASAGVWAQATVPPYVKPGGPDPLCGGYPRAHVPHMGLDLAALDGMGSGEVIAP
jgi:hypothetical protein